MNVTLLPRGEDLIRSVASVLSPGQTDYSQSAVIFPGKRPAHFLRRELARSAGTGLIPPKIFSIDEFVDLLCAGENLKKMETVDAVAVLYEIHREGSARMGSFHFETLERFYPLGARIFRDLEELLIEGIDPDRIARVDGLVEEGIPKLSESNLVSLSGYYRSFYRKTRALDFRTRSESYRLGLHRLKTGGSLDFEKIIVAGFYALTRSEIEIFKELSDRAARFVFQEGPGLAGHLLRLGIAIETVSTARDEPAVFFYSSPDPHGEVFALSEALDNKLRKGSWKEEKGVVLVPSADILFPLLRQGIPHWKEESYNVSLGYPLVRTPLFGFFNLLAILVQSTEETKVSLSDYINCFLHPYAKNIYYKGSSETTRILFQTLEEELLIKRSHANLTLSEIEEKSDVFAEVLIKTGADRGALTVEALKNHLRYIHDSVLRPFLNLEDLSDFAKKGIFLLDFITIHSPAGLHPDYFPYLASFRDSLESLSRSRLGSYAFQKAGSYFNFLKQMIAGIHTPFPGTPLKGMQILGGLETRNLTFETVFILDANEGIIPNSPAERSLIPFRVREELSLPTEHDRESIAAYYFDTLIAGAKEVHFFYVEDQIKERSRYVEKLIWQREKKESRINSGYHIQKVQYRLDLTNRDPSPIPKRPAELAFLKECRYSATSLDSYLKCPIRYYYSSVLKLKPVESRVEPVGRDELGTFVHRILTDYFSAKRNKILDEKDLDDRDLEKLVDRHLEQKYGVDPAGPHFLMGRQIKRHLRDFLKCYSLPLVRQKRVEVLTCEEKIDIRFRSYNLTGRIDQVEKRNEELLILDYKTGSNPERYEIKSDRLDSGNRNEWGNLIGSLQLPFYLLLYLEKYRTETRAVNAAYLFLGRSRLGPDIERPLFVKGTDREAFNLYRKIIATLLDEINDPSLPFSPTKDKKNCSGCPYQVHCGTQWVP